MIDQTATNLIINNQQPTESFDQFRHQRWEFEKQAKLTLETLLKEFTKPLPK